MKRVAFKFITCLTLIIASLLAAPLQAVGNQGHNQSGIIGRVQIEQVGVNLPWQVRVSTETGESVAVLELGDEGEFLVNLKPGAYRLTPVAYIWFTVNGVWTSGEFVGPTLEVTVAKKDFTPVELPVVWQDDWPSPGDRVPSFPVLY